jgi:tetratricopeptide (TPR) repeat protein
MQAKDFLNAGQEDKARAVVLRCRGVREGDAAFFSGLAEVCEELGMARQGQEFYERALKESPEDSEVLFRFARLLAEVGHYEKSLRYLKKALRCNPEHEAAKTLLAENYRELGLSGLADVLLPESGKGATALSPVRYFPPSIGRRDTGWFLELFSGREVGYAVQEVEPRLGELSCTYQDGPLTESLIAAHLRGEISLAACPLRSDNTVRYAAVAVRLPSSVVEANVKSRGYLGFLQEKVRQHILILSRYAKGLGISAYAEEKGDGTCRLWFFFKEFTHFLKVRQFVLDFVRNAPQPEGRLVVEPVLATKGIGMGWTEDFAALPLGIERSTLRRSLFLDESGKAYGEQLKFIRGIQRVVHVRALEAVRLLQSGGLSSPDQRRTLPAIVQPLVKRCSVIGELVRMAFAGRVLRREEKVVLFYTLGPADSEGDSLHIVLAACPDYDHQNVSKQLMRLKSNPVSCTRIRELIPEVTASVGCNCSFDLRGGKYPSPLLHINRDLVPAAEENLLPENAPLREAARRYLHLKLHQDEIERTILRCEAVLEKHFGKKGTDRFKVGSATLLRTEENGCVSWRIERN